MSLIRSEFFVFLAGFISNYCSQWSWAFSVSQIDKWLTCDICRKIKNYVSNVSWNVWKVNPLSVVGSSRFVF